MIRHLSGSVLPIAAFRCLGGATFLSPKVGARTFGVPADADGSYLVRLFAARNLTLAAGVAIATGETRRFVLRCGIACDVLDIVAGVQGWREGKAAKDAAVDTGLSALATSLGVLALTRDRRMP